MKRLLAIWGTIFLSSFAAAAKPPVAQVDPVTDDYFGTSIVDPYRYMENTSDPRTQAWMKGQADYARATLDALPDRASLLVDISKYVDAAPAAVGSVNRCPGERYFLLKTLAGQSIAKLYVRQGLHGQDTLLVDTDRFTGPHGAPPAINYFTPSNDGRHVAFGVSQGGSEMATIHIVDADSGKELKEAIDRAEWGEINWRPDNHSFFYSRLQKLGPKSNPIEKYDKSMVYLHELGTAADQDIAVMGFGLSPRVVMTPMDEPFVESRPGSDWAVGVVWHGVQEEGTFYVAPLASLGRADTPWVKICDVDDDVTDYAFQGDDIYLLTHNDAPRFKLIETSLAHPDVTHAKVIVPQGPTVLRNVVTAADAVYVREIDSGVYHILRVGQTIERLNLPFDGTANIFSTDPRLPGVIFSLAGWTKGSRILQYDPATDQVVPTDIQPAGPYDNLDELTSVEIKVPSYDGALVPLSIVYRKGTQLNGSNPTALYAYGGYGITVDPGFNPAYVAWIERGGIYAIAHCRGGGELGETWHLGAYKLTKPNVWRDLIACSQYLIHQKYTSSSRLGIFGGSNGGIVIGRAVTEQPDLFAAAWIRSGLVNPLRAEEEPNGPPNVPEFGSARTQEGFEDLYAMDAYQHVRDGVEYPAVLQTTGINDPRVSPAEPAKFTARLQAASTSGEPILLNIDYQGGHGIGASKLQRIQQNADMFAFFLSSFSRRFFSPNVRADIEYAPGVKLDAYVPDRAGTFPIAIVVHGGGWTNGDKERDITPILKTLSDGRFVWFSINYRMAPRYHWPDCYDDTLAAIRWVKSHAAEYKGDPNRIALIGYSAGGELACLAATQEKVQAVVGCAPPTDMEADTQRRGGLSKSLIGLFGTSVLDDSAHALLRQMSAINFVHAGMPPFLLIHGTADKSVPYEQSIHFQAALKSVGVPCELETINEAPHNIAEWEKLDPGYEGKIADFLLAMRSPGN
jgi:prolyl oligopeptidase